MNSQTLRFAALVVLAIAAISFAACGGGDDDDSALSSASGVLSLDDRAVPQGTTAASKPAGGLAVPQSETGAGAGGAPALAGQFERKVILNATLQLDVPNVGQSFSDAGRIAQLVGGYVEKSTFTAITEGKADGPRAATLTLRVPASNYQDVLASLRGLNGAKVRQEGSQSSEVTEQYTDLQSRLRTLERTEQQYLKLLEQARTIDEILKMQDRLDAVRTQIEQIQGRLNVLDHLTDLATIDVSLATPPLATARTGDGSSSFGETFSSAWAGALDAARGLSRAIAVIIVAAIWLGIPALIIAFAARTLRRRHTAAQS